MAEYVCGPAPVGEPELRSVGHLLWHQRRGTPACGASQAEAQAAKRDWYQRNKTRVLAHRKQQRAAGLGPRSIPYRERVARRPGYARYKNTKRYLRRLVRDGKITAEERTRRQAEAKAVYEADPHATAAGWGVCGSTSCENAEPELSECVCECGGTYHAWHKTGGGRSIGLERARS